MGGYVKTYNNFAQIDTYYKKNKTFLWPFKSYDKFGKCYSKEVRINFFKEGYLRALDMLI